jgi:hypothetical protein
MDKSNNTTNRPETTKRNQPRNKNGKPKGAPQPKFGVSSSVTWSISGVQGKFKMESNSASVSFPLLTAQEVEDHFQATIRALQTESNKRQVEEREKLAVAKAQTNKVQDSDIPDATEIVDTPSNSETVDKQ